MHSQPTAKVSAETARSLANIKRHREAVAQARARQLIKAGDALTGYAGAINDCRLILERFLVLKGREPLEAYRTLHARRRLTGDDYTNTITGYKTIERAWTDEDGKPRYKDGKPEHYKTKVRVEVEEELCIFGGLVRRKAVELGMPAKSLQHYVEPELRRVCRAVIEEILASAPKEGEELTEQQALMRDQGKQWHWYPLGWRDAWKRNAPPARRKTKAKAKTKTKGGTDAS